MNPSPKRYPLKDERDQQIDVQAKSHAQEYVIAATQILTLLCLLKGSTPKSRTDKLALFFSPSGLHSWFGLPWPDKSSPTPGNFLGNGCE